MSDPLADQYCGTAECSSGAKIYLDMNWSKEQGNTIKEDRTVTLKIGAATVKLQDRKRDFKFSESQQQAISLSKLVYVTTPSGEPYGIHCGSSSEGDHETELSESYSTVDTEIEYLDLRYDIIVTKEVANEIKFSSKDSTSPTFVGIFTGYKADAYPSFVFDKGVDIKETIKHYFVSGAATTLLNEESVGRGFPYIALIMPTFPVSAWGLRFTEEWSQDIDWYRQDLRKTPDKDGDAYLYYAEWCTALGQMNQVMDKQLASLKYDLQQTELSGAYGRPEIALKDMFEGGVALDPNGNMFYSIAVNTSEYANPPAYEFKNKLTVDGVDKELPKEKVRDKVMIGDPPEQKKDSNGDLVWTEEKESEYNAWYPISPI